MTIEEITPWLAIAITLILSILVPLFTQIANNRFQLKMKKKDIEAEIQNKKFFAYEEYFQKVGGCVLYAQKENLSDAGASIQRLYAYLPENEWETLDKLFAEINNKDWAGARNDMKSISKWIANDMKN